MNSIHMFTENLATALSSLGTSRMRSILTILGIVIGIASMTAVTSLLQGFNSQVNSTFEKLGTSTVYISRSSGQAMSGGRGRMQNTRPELETDYIETILQIENVEAAVPLCTTMKTVKTTDGVELTTTLRGTDTGWLDVAGRELTEGRFFIDFEVQSRRNVCVVGSSIAERMFGTLQCTGMELFAGGRKLTVTGVLEESGEIMGQDLDNMVVVPFTIFHQWASLGENLQIMVLVSSPDLLDTVQEDIEMTMRQLRGLSLEEENNFDLMTSESLKEGFSDVSTWLFIGLLGLSGISLFTGSVGIANIMLVSVSQRTGEIGLRKALGATPGRILAQFVTESVILSLLGGLIGIITGALLAGVLATLTDMTTGLNGAGIAAAVLVSTLTGVVAGLYPAAKGAKLQPVVALSHNI